MAPKNKTRDAVEILHRRYVKGPEDVASLERERLHAQIARIIHDLRTGAGLTQQELAERIGTTQSVISRLEDADYEGHSLSMLNKIAEALNQRVTVMMTASDDTPETVRYVFREVLRNLRRSQALTTAELASHLDVDEDEIIAIERTIGYRPQPRTLHKLAQFYRIPTQRLAELAGAVREVPRELEAEASRFAAQSDSFRTLDTDEKALLDKFVAFLRQDIR